MTYRAVIKVVDIAFVLGLSIPQARKYLRDMKKFYGCKSRREFVTVDEFCKYSRVKPSDVEAYFTEIGELGSSRNRKRQTEDPDG